MTPAEHLAIAEGLMANAPSPTSPDFERIDQAMTAAALTHAVIALAIELGVPAPATNPKGA